MLEKIEVICKYEYSGDIIPLEIIWHDGQRFKIDRILQVCPFTGKNNEGITRRYTCMIHQHRRYLYFSKKYWYVERI